MPEGHSLHRLARLLHRSFAGAAVAAILAGCAGPAIRSQSPEVAALLGMESDIRLVSDYAAAWGTHPQRIERAEALFARTGAVIAHGGGLLKGQTQPGQNLLRHGEFVVHTKMGLLDPQRL